MDTLSYNVTELSADQRHAFEDVLGQPLRDDQRLLIQVANQPKAADGSGVRQAPTADASGKPPELPDWVTIFADLSDEEMAELEAAILDRSDSRPVDLP